MHRLPQRPLEPRIVWGPESRREARENYDAVGPIGRARIDAVTKWREARRAEEAPTRAQAYRRRLAAAFWAGWNAYLSSVDGRWKKALDRRGLFQGPKWIGGRR